MELQIVQVLNGGRHFLRIIDVGTYCDASIDYDHHLVMVKLRSKSFRHSQSTVRCQRRSPYNLEQVKQPNVVIEHAGVDFLNMSRHCTCLKVFRK